MNRGEINVTGIGEQGGFNRDVQAVMDGVVELPEPYHTGKFDYLGRRQMGPEPLQQLIGHVNGICRSGAYLIEADPLQLVFLHDRTADDCLQLLFAKTPSLLAA